MKQDKEWNKDDTVESYGCNHAVVHIWNLGFGIKKKKKKRKEKKIKKPHTENKHQRWVS
jgi:hypothetical protein